jgi:hypothetical protein
MRKMVVYIAFTMAVILASPLLLLSVHAFANHHDEEILFPTRELSITHPEHCLLCEFEYTQMMFSHTVLLIVSPYIYIETIELIEPVVFGNDNRNLASLRAPPAVV